MEADDRADLTHRPSAVELAGGRVRESAPDASERSDQHEEYDEEDDEDDDEDSSSDDEDAERERKRIAAKKRTHGWDTTGGKWWDLGIDTNWLAAWGGNEALRELMQNLCDQVISSSNAESSITLEPSKTYEHDIEVHTISSDDTPLAHLVHDPVNRLFAMVNKGCHLPRDCLHVGFTTKNGSNRLAGKFGEGLKGAIVVALNAGKTLEIHQSCRTLSFKKFVDGNHSWIGYKIATRYSKQGKIKEFLIWMQRRKLADRKSDIIQVLGDFDEPLSVLDSFLQLKHKQGTDYDRLQTKHGDILLQVGKSSQDLSGRVYVAGVLWMQDVEGQKNYGVDLKKGVSNNRDRNEVERSSYEKAVAKVINAVLMDRKMRVRTSFITLLLKELHQARKIHDVPHLRKLGTYLSTKACAVLKKGFLRRYGKDKTWIVTKEEATSEKLTRYIEVESTCVSTSEYFCALLRDAGVSATLEEIMEDATKRLVSAPVTCICEWPAEIKQAVEVIFKPFDIWSHIVMHTAEDGGASVPECVYDADKGGLIHLSERINHAAALGWDVIPQLA